MPKKKKKSLFALVSLSPVRLGLGGLQLEQLGPLRPAFKLPPDWYALPAAMMVSGHAKRKCIHV